MRENDEITGLFRRRLGKAEMEVREGFWEELQRDLPKAEMVSHQKNIPFSPRFYRVVAAASVVFVLGAASAAFWYFSPKEEIKQAFTEVATLTTGGNLNGDIVQESFPPIQQTASASQMPGLPGSREGDSTVTGKGDEDEKVSVRVSITITQRVYGNRQPQENGHYAHAGGMSQYDSLSDNVSEQNTHSSATMSEDADGKGECVQNSVRNWAMKAAVGTSLPKGNFLAPVTLGVTVERKLNKILSLESGLQYNFLPVSKSVADQLHTLSVPVRMNVSLVASPKVELYAVVGGTVEKSVNKSFNEDPVRLSAMAGLGVGYKVNERLSLFAEPLLSHYFATDSSVRSLRSERRTNMNLLCGVRMAY